MNKQTPIKNDIWKENNILSVFVDFETCLIVWGREWQLQDQEKGSA